VAEGAWDVKVLQRHREDDPNETCPAEVFLDGSPRSVAADLIAIVDAVAESPPPRFTGGGMGGAMHGEMSGYYEARTRGPYRRLYRLFCLLEREVSGIDRPSIVVIAGLSKPVGTAIEKEPTTRWSAGSAMSMDDGFREAWCEAP
jgi:hypothetical protein